MYSFMHVGGDTAKAPFPGLGPIVRVHIACIGTYTYILYIYIERERGGGGGKKKKKKTRGGRGGRGEGAFIYSRPPGGVLFSIISHTN